MLLAQAARRMRIAEKLAAVIPDPRDPTRVVHPLPQILLARILAIACGYHGSSRRTSSDGADDRGKMGRTVAQVVPSTEVITTCSSASVATAWATRSGSRGSRASGKPVRTLQKAQPRGYRCHP